MTYQTTTVPAAGARITATAGVLNVPDNPIVAFIEGDGIGRDIMNASKRVWDAAVEKTYGGTKRIAWMEIYAGEKANERFGAYMPGETFQLMRDFLIGIKGPLTTPVGGGFRSLNVTLRQELDLYACVRPVRWYRGVPSPLKDPGSVNITVFREAVEDVYSGIEFEAGTPENARLAKFLREEMGVDFFEGSGLGVKPISAFATKRLMRKAIRYALDRKLKFVSIMHKGNIMKFTEGAFRQWCYEVAAEEFAGQTITEDELWDRHGGKAPEGKVVVKDRIADITFQHMLLRPTEFDVVVAPNLNGDYLSDALAAEVGGVGIAPGANIGDAVALFEATHGTAPKYTDQNKVNPGSLLFSGVMMLEHIGWWDAAKRIEDAYEKTLDQKIVTYDFARQMEGATEVGTREFADAVIKNM
ncbi:MAG: isocitrate dehydrogenase (NADP(+)) [Anaerolineae bacterium]|nr:isocitrate dehydrogenase (NADP(+)) [Anaerolineae bacterium]